MKKWNILNNSSDTNILELLLENRGLKTAEDKKKFLEPLAISTLLYEQTPEFKKCLKEVKELVEQAIKSKTPIIIHGDYDADGVCATAILFNTLKNELKYEDTHAFIPNRFDHGYGLSKKSIDELLEKIKPKGRVLYITVDSGITAVEAVEYLKAMGHTVIITDHHQKPSKLPPADCILWNDQMVGSGISWVLSRVLGSLDPKSIALAALATVTDLQPLLNFNRSLVKEGLNVINSNPPLGLKKLLDTSGKLNGEITSYELGWLLGPRLNASGRLSNANDPLSLLTEKDENLIAEIAQRLNEINVQRQDKTLEMYEVAKFDDTQSIPKIIISANEKYHEGIIGLVAARLTQKYYRPAIVISLAEEHAKGSVRSVNGIDIIAVLRKFEELFVNLGGHPMAAGFTISKENLIILQERLLAYARDAIDENLLQPSLEVDLKLPLEMVNLELTEQIKQLKPFGIGNNEPIFVSENVGIAGINTVGKENQHTSLRLYDGFKYYKGIFFNGSEQCKNLSVGQKINIAYYVKENNYNGTRSVELIIKDFQKPLD